MDLFITIIYLDPFLLFKVSMDAQSKKKVSMDAITPTEANNAINKTIN